MERKESRRRKEGRNDGQIAIDLASTTRILERKEARRRKEGRNDGQIAIDLASTTRFMDRKESGRRKEDRIDGQTVKYKRIPQAQTDRSVVHLDRSRLVLRTFPTLGIWPARAYLANNLSH